jgi:hypothetical protein
MPEAKRSHVASYHLSVRSFCRLCTECIQNLSACMYRTVRHREIFPLRFKEPSEKVAKPKTPVSLMMAD